MNYLQLFVATFDENFAFKIFKNEPLVSDLMNIQQQLRIYYIFQVIIYLITFTFITSYVIVIKYQFEFFIISLFFNFFNLNIFQINFCTIIFLFE